MQNGKLTIRCLKQCMANLLEDGKQKSTIAVLDGVRGTACLIVVFFHLNYFARGTNIWHPIHDLGSVVGALALAGQAGVTLFFVLSGFLLFMPYVKALLFDSKWPSMRLFYLKRAFRIIPAYYVSLFLMILLFHPEYFQPDHWKDVGMFLIFFMDAPATYQKINGPFWTLAVEAQFYMILPFLALGISLLVRRGTMRWRIPALVLCLFTVIGWGLFSRYWGNYFMINPSATLPGLSRSQLNTLLILVYGNSGKYLEDFAIGMLLCTCFIYVQSMSPDGRWNIALRRLSPILWVVGLAVLLFMALWHFNLWYYGYALHFLDPLIHDYDQWHELILSIGFGLCMLAILYGPAYIKRPFEWSPLRWIGLISFSLYMWHVPLIAAFATYVVPYMHGWRRSVEYGVYGLWVLLAIIPFALLLYLIIEKPWIQVGERLRRRIEARKQATTDITKTTTGI